MRTSLVPGGTVLCLGSASETYNGIYAVLDQKAKAAHVRQLKDVTLIYKKWASPMVLQALTELSRSMWRKLEGKNYATEVRERLTKLNASAIFDTTIRFRLPQFKLRAYRRGK